MDIGEGDECSLSSLLAPPTWAPVLEVEEVSQKWKWNNKSAITRIDQLIAKGHDMVK